MKQDVNNIINNLTNEWAQALAESNKKTAILQEENRLLKEENTSVKQQLKEQVEVNAEK